MHEGRFIATPHRSVNTATGHRAVAHIIRVGQNGTPCVQVFFKVADGQECAGEVVRWKGWLTDNALEYCVKDLNTMGWTGTDISKLSDGDLAKKCSIVVEEQEHEGKTYFEVQWVNEAGIGTLKSESPIQGEELEQFGASLEAQITALRGGASPPPGTDDTLPF